jgi:hypothetical protein
MNIYLNRLNHSPSVDSLFNNKYHQGSNLFLENKSALTSFIEILILSLRPVLLLVAKLTSAFNYHIPSLITLLAAYLFNIE